MIDEYINYHKKSAKIGDIDPQNAALKYICDRFELNIEQRYWIAFLFGCCYCAPTVYFIYNEFPDFENVDTKRMELWWSKNKHKLLFQTDRLRIKTQDKLVETFESYRELIGSSGQEKFFRKLCLGSKKENNYDKVFDAALKIKNFGRFSNFIYLELLYVLCNIPILPSRLDVANAESCTNGMMYAINKEHMIGKKLSNKNVEAFEKVFIKLCNKIKKTVQGKEPFSPWGVETTLCAFKKHKKGKRWVGYYIDRQGEEIKKLEQAVTDGVNWSPLWQFREEYYPEKYLYEKTGTKSSLEKPYL